MPNAETNSDYLAIIPIGGGSSWGRAPIKEDAIERAIRQLRDWESLFQVAGIEVTVNVIDVQGYDHVVWGADGIHGNKGDDTKFERIDRPFEAVKRMTPQWRKRA